MRAKGMPTMAVVMAEMEKRSFLSTTDPTIIMTNFWGAASSIKEEEELTPELVCV